MDREPTQKPDDQLTRIGPPEGADDDLADIDPADFLDLEEFGISQRR